MRHFLFSMHVSSPGTARWALIAYLLLAVVQTWPLASHLSTDLPGDTGGDTSVYVWNPWVFRHEIVEDHHTPFWTETILPLQGGADLSLHNYTVWTDLVALPLQQFMDTIAAFNVVFIFNAALTG